MSNKATFKDLATDLSVKTGRSRRSTVEFIRNLTDVIEEGLRDDGSATLAGFGKIELRRMKARKGVKPGSGDKIDVSAQNKVVFKPFKTLRKQVNQPFEHLEASLLKDDSKKGKTVPGPASGNFSTADLPADTSVDAPAPAEESVNDLVYERPSPLDKKYR